MISSFCFSDICLMFTFFIPWITSKMSSRVFIWSFDTSLSLRIISSWDSSSNLTLFFSFALSREPPSFKTLDIGSYLTSYYYYGASYSISLIGVIPWFDSSVFLCSFLADVYWLLCSWLWWCSSPSVWLWLQTLLKISLFSFYLLFLSISLSISLAFSHAFNNSFFFFSAFFYFFRMKDCWSNFLLSKSSSLSESTYFTGFFFLGSNFHNYFYNSKSKTRSYMSCNFIW